MVFFFFNYMLAYAVFAVLVTRWCDSGNERWGMVLFYFVPLFPHSSLLTLLPETAIHDDNMACGWSC